MPGYRRDREERQRADEGAAPEPSVDECDRRERRADDCDDPAHLVGQPEPGRPGIVVRNQRRSAQEGQEEAGERERPEDAFVRLCARRAKRRPPGQRHEEGDADGDEQSGEEEPAGDHSTREVRAPGRQGGGRRRAPCANRERKHTVDRVPVIGEHAPAHRVVPVAKVSQRDRD